MDIPVEEDTPIIITIVWRDTQETHSATVTHATREMLRDAWEATANLPGKDVFTFATQATKSRPESIIMLRFADVLMIY